MSFSNRIFAVIAALSVVRLCFGEAVPRPDRSTEKDAIFFEVPSDQVRFLGGVKLEAPRAGLEHLKKVAAIPPQRLALEPPGLELEFNAPSYGYYTVSAFGYPEKALWRGDEFIWFICRFGDMGYTMKTQEPGEKSGEDTPGIYHELCRFYFIVPAAGSYPVKLLIKYCPVSVYIHKIEIRRVDAHFSTTPIKKGVTIYSAEKIAELRERAKTGATVFPRVMAPDGLKVADEELWNGIPDWTSFRGFWHNFDCPVHGAEIRKKHAIYPWITSRKDGKWGVTCPIGGETYPSNDYRMGDLTSGDYPDDGSGWYDAEHKAPAAKDYQLAQRESLHGPNYFFVGFNAHEILRDAGERAKAYGAAYILTGEAAYAHKAGILLARMAYIYPCMDWTYQSTEGAMWYRPDAIHVRRGRCTQWAVESQILNPLLETYDILYDYLVKDDALLQFVSARVPWVKSMEDLRLLIDRNILQLAYDAVEVLLGRYASSTWSVLGRVAGKPEWFRRSLDVFTVQVWTEPVLTGVTNLLDRDGTAVVALLSYYFNIMEKLASMAQDVDRFGEPLSTEFDFWRGEPFAKWRTALETWPRYIVAGEHFPNMGDSSSSPVGYKARYLSGERTLEIMRPWYALGYKYLRTPFYAYYAGGAKGRQYIPDASTEILDSIAQDAEKYRPRPLRTRNLPGPGLCILEAHAESKPPARAGLACRYGTQIAEHAHKDSLNVEFFAKGIDMAPDFGWPPDTKMPERHNLLATEEYDLPAGGWLRLLVDGPGCYFADLSGLPGKISLEERSHFHRRALSLMEVGEEDSYLFDLSRARTAQGPHTLYWHGTQGTLEITTAEAPLPQLELDKPHLFKGQLIATWRVDMKASGGAEYYPNSQLYFRERVLPAGERSVIKTNVKRNDFPSSFIVGVQDSTPPPPGGKKESLFAAVLEPYEKEPFIREVAELPLSSAANRLPRAYRITSQIPRTQKQQVDWHLFAGPGLRAETKEVSLFEGAYGLYQETDRQFSRMLLCGNSEIPESSSSGPCSLATPALTLSLTTGLYQSKIVAVDWKAGKVKLSSKFPATVAGGNVLIVSPTGRITNYNVVNVTHNQATDATELTLEHLYPLFVGPVAEIDSQNGFIRTKLEPRFGASGRTFHYGYGRFLDGAYLVDEARTGQALLARYGEVPGKSGNWFRLADPKQIIHLKDAPGPSYGPLGKEEHLIFVYDVGAGDTIYFVPWGAVVRMADDSYAVKGTGDLALSWPGRVSVRVRDGKGQELKLETEFSAGATLLRVPSSLLWPDGVVVNMAGR